MCSRRVATFSCHKANALTAAKTLLEIVFSFCKNSSQIDKCLYRLLLLSCPMLPWPATISLQCLVLEPIIDKLRKLPKTPILGILLVTVRKLLTGSSRSVTREWQPQALMKGTSSNSPDHWHCCKLRALSFGCTPYSWRRLHLTSDPVQMPENLKSNWLRREVADIT